MLDRPYCRLTVLAPRQRVDVALPADVPVAELVPMLLELLDEPTRPSGPWRPDPWRLTGAAGGPLPTAATLSELGVLDGELLRIGRDAPPPAAPVFDDPVDALAAGAGTGRDDRRFGSAAVLVVAAAAAALMAGAGPGAGVAALPAATAAVAALAYTAHLVRGSGPTLGVAHTAALAAVPLAGAAGWTAVPPGSAPLVAVAATGTAAAVAQVLLRVVAPVLVGTVVAAVLAAGGVVGVQLGQVPTAASALVAAVAVVAGPLLPRIALRLAGLPRPVVPADGSELGDADVDVLPPDELAERADLARGFLAGLAGACAVVAAAGAVLAATAGGWAGPSFAGVVVVVLVLRARCYADDAPALVTVSAAIGAGVVLAALAAPASSAVRAAAAVALLVVAGAGLVAAGRATPGASPVSRRAIDLVEGLLVAAAVPLAFAAMDLFGLVRGL
ncbi:MAG: hypothetical protein QOF00_4030 [Pseudonocardiales bacterium]|nr:hypothetical protein [Pseudonocardiales bacterium]